MALKRRSSDDAERKRSKRSKASELTQAPANQAYCVVPSDKRFGLLSTFLKKNSGKKIVVIFASPRTLRFHSEVLDAVGIPSTTMSDRQVAERRTTLREEFRQSEKGVLLCTNNVASELDGLDADWIVQFEPPQSGDKFLGRISRNKCRGLVFLLPEELEFLAFLKDASVPLTECDFRDIKVANMHSQMEKLVAKQFRINQLAHDAYRAYLLNYNEHPMKKAFDVKKLHLHNAAASFGIKCPQKVL